MSYLSRLKQLAGDEKFTDSPRPEPTELTKGAFGGFVSTVPGVYDNISANDSAAESSLKVGAGDTVADLITDDDEKAIRAWLALIEETDPAIIADVLNKCRTDEETLDYFTARAAAELPELAPFPDDRRSCTQCTNLRQGICTIAKPEVGALVVASRGYRPVILPLRCAGYSPKPVDTDQRGGLGRWPFIREVAE